MFIDAFTQVSAAQALTATAVSTNTIDLSAIDPDIGIGEPVGFQITVDVAADFTTMDETYQFNIVGDDDAALGSPVVLVEQIKLAADLTAGHKFFLPLPSGIISERYIGLQFVLGGTTPTVTVSAHLCPQSMSENDNPSYASGFTVS